MTTGERIKHLRTSRGYTQQHLADMMHTTKQSVCMWESGKNMPSRISLEALGDIFNVDTDYLLCRESVSMRYLDTVELDLIDAFRRMSEDQQELVCRMCGIELKRDVKSQNFA